MRIRQLGHPSFPVWLTLICLLLFQAMPAHASIYLDPHIGGTFGLWKVQRSTTTYDLEAKGSSQALTYGLRLAYALPSLFFGVDYSQGSVAWNFNKIANSSVDDGWQNVKGSSQAWGPIIGYKSPKSAFTLWASYFYRSELRLDTDTDTSISKPIYSGSGYGVGLGFFMLGPFRLNLEYQKHTFDHWETAGNSVPLSGTIGNLTQGKISHDVYLASISYPIVF
jgi:hypothetical protein